MSNFVHFICSVGQQKRADHAQFDHVGAEAGEQSEADQPSGGQRVAQPELQPVRPRVRIAIIHRDTFLHS